MAVPPSAKVSDQSGNPMQGVTVHFAVTSGGGSVTGEAGVTNEFGIATVGSWILGEPLGVNTMTATIQGLAPVVFTATGVPGPPAVLVPSGDHQAVNYGNPVPVPAGVTVKDAHNHILAGVEVVFEVGFGFGSITGAKDTTDANGFAQVGSWTLGQAGMNTLLANVPGKVFFVFNAEGLTPCQSRPSTIGTAIDGSLQSGDCQLDNGAYVDLFDQTVATTGGAFTLRITSSFDPHVYVYFASDRSDPLAEVFRAPGAPDATVKIIGPPTQTSYTFFVSSVSGGQTGTYSLLTSAVSADVTNCEQVFLVKGADTNQSLETTDCGNPSYHDDFKVYLEDQGTIVVDMVPTGFVQNLQLFDPSGALVATETIPTRIVYRADAAGYYVIRAGSTTSNQTGSYRLTVH